MRGLIKTTADVECWRDLMLGRAKTNQRNRLDIILSPRIAGAFGINHFRAGPGVVRCGVAVLHERSSRGFYLQIATNIDISIFFVWVFVWFGLAWFYAMPFCLAALSVLVNSSNNNNKKRQTFIRGC